MRKYLLAIRMVFYLLDSSAMLAQTAVAPPAVGMVRDGAGGVHQMVGVPGNFIVLDDSAVSKAISAAFSGSAGLVKTDSELLLLDATGKITQQWDASAGPALFAFDASGGPALAYYAGTLFQLGNGGLTPVNWTGEALSIASIDPQSAAAVIRHQHQLSSVRINLATGNIESEIPLKDVTAPVMLLPNAGLLFTRDTNLVIRDSSGVERLVPAGFRVDSFETIGKDWIAVREAGGGRLFGLRVSAQNGGLYQLPEVSQ